MIDFKKYIGIDPDVRFGKPILKGTRISVYDVLAWMAEGMSVQEIIHDFPELEEEQIKACLAYAAEKENKLRVV
ncbi:DUF433 domain-containing protein [Salinimicrobium sp. CDJ15-81-2]|nr:DUF433 domain-containing protein [Salinimicrobium nanhaiense]